MDFERVGPSIDMQRPVGAPAPAPTRLLYIDNLRWTMIILVVSMHAADTYSPLGNWYYTDRRALSLPVLLTFAAWQMYLQSFFMGLLFFIAGYFVPPSYDRKGPWRFIRGRSFRLGLPVLFYMFVLGPVTEYYVAHSWTSTQPTSFPNEWLKHILNGQFLQENGPLWFCLALLIFSLLYAGYRACRPKAATIARRPPGARTLICFALIMAALSFAVRLPRPAPFLNMHLQDFPQYALLFMGGAVAARQGWLGNLSYSSGLRWLAIVLPSGLTAWLAILLGGGLLQGKTDVFSGGWHWQSGALDVWESTTCVALCFGLLVIYRERFNSQGLAARFLSDNAFAVYVFHPPVIIGIARVMRSAAWHPLVQFAALTVAAAAATFALSAAVFRRIPLLKSIL